MLRQDSSLLPSPPSLALSSLYPHTLSSPALRSPHCLACVSVSSPPAEGTRELSKGGAQTSPPQDTRPLDPLAELSDHHLVTTRLGPEWLCWDTWASAPWGRQSWGSRWRGLSKPVPSVLDTSTHRLEPPDPTPGLRMAWGTSACPTFGPRGGQMLSCQPAPHLQPSPPSPLPFNFTFLLPPPPLSPSASFVCFSISSIHSLFNLSLMCLTSSSSQFCFPSCHFSHPTYFLLGLIAKADLI